MRGVTPRSAAIRALASISSARIRDNDCASSAFWRENGKLPLHECVSEWLPISCPAAATCLHPSRRRSTADGTTKKVALVPCRANTGRPVVTWLSRPSSKLRLSAMRAPAGQMVPASEGAWARGATARGRHRQTTAVSTANVTERGDTGIEASGAVSSPRADDPPAAAATTGTIAPAQP